MKQHLLVRLIFLFTFCNIGLYAQQVTGVVTSVEDGLSLIGVNVVIKGTAVGTITDVDGSYSLQLDGKGDTLVFTYTGFADRVIAVNGQSTINVFITSKRKLLMKGRYRTYTYQKKWTQLAQEQRSNLKS
ncbi:MAG: carboxypeptidase-like regulatory domain-containing protein [Saprospiraceae bacterium]